MSERWRESGKKIEREREREGMRKCGKAKEIEVGIAREYRGFSRAEFERLKLKKSERSVELTVKLQK